MIKEVFVFTMLLVTIAGCSGGNPVSPISDTIQSDNLQITFSIPRSSYGAHDTLVATTTAFNPGDSTVSFIVPVCWPIAWYTVQNIGGTTKLSYSAPRDLGCNSVAEYSILPHQSQQIALMRVMVSIADLDSTQGLQGSYVLTVDNGFGTFLLEFNVN